VAEGILELEGEEQVREFRTGKWIRQRLPASQSVKYEVQSKVV
jgi:hypothetical protein